MKFYIRTILILSAVIVWTAAPVRAGQNVEVLSDETLATVRGGFCPFSKCETGAPTGNCEPVPDDPKTLCAPGVCTKQAAQFGGVGGLICVLAGKYTCSEPGNYRKCVWGHINEICWKGNGNTCGFLIAPFCQLNLQTRSCDCDINFNGQTPCDWTSCLLEAQ